MLTAYVRAALRQAEYEILADGEGYYGSIPDLQGVWANRPTLESCREELQEVLEEWLVLRLRRGADIPILESIDLNSPADQVA
jgi:predicted RNase H-like HicB family nuclease